jgi:ribonuclease P protein component
VIATIHDFGFPRRARLIKTDDFSSVFNFRRRISGNFLVIHYQYNEQSRPRLGLVIAKKNTHFAVTRNYMRRVLRELFRLNWQSAGLSNVDLIVRTQKTFTHTDFGMIKKEYEELLAQLRQRTAASNIVGACQA